MGRSVVRYYIKPPETKEGTATDSFGPMPSEDKPPAIEMLRKIARIKFPFLTQFDDQEFKINRGSRHPVTIVCDNPDVSYKHGQQIDGDLRIQADTRLLGSTEYVDAVEIVTHRIPQSALFEEKPETALHNSYYFEPDGVSEGMLTVSLVVCAERRFIVSGGWVKGDDVLFEMLKSIARLRSKIMKTNYDLFRSKKK